MNVLVQEGVKTTVCALSTSAGAYSIGDQIGSAQTLELPPGLSGKDVIIKSIVVNDNANQGKGLSLWFFTGSAPVVADNAPFAFGSDAVALQVCGIVPVVSGDYVTLDSRKFTTLYGNLGQVLKANAGNTIQMVVVCDEAATYGSSSEKLQVIVGLGREA